MMKDAMGGYHILFTKTVCRWWWPCQARQSFDCPQITGYRLGQEYSFYKMKGVWTEPRACNLVGQNAAWVYGCNLQPRYQKLPV